MGADGPLHIKRAALLIALSTWTLPVGFVLDLIDLAFGDMAQGPEWSIAGGMGVVTATLPATIVCLLLRARKLATCLLAGLGAGGGVIIALGIWSIVEPAPLIIIAATATSVGYWHIRRPDHDTWPNPATPPP